MSLLCVYDLESRKSLAHQDANAALTEEDKEAFTMMQNPMVAAQIRKKEDEARHLREVANQLEV